MKRSARDLRPSDPAWLVDPDRIAAAAASINPVFLNTPVVRGPDLDGAVGARVIAKVETLNPIKCFKGRGTDHCVSRLSSTARHRFRGQLWPGPGLLHPRPRRRGDGFAAEAASPLKMAAISRLGAQVRLAGQDFDEAKAAAREHAHLTGAVFAEDSSEACYAEGAGTMAMEPHSAGFRP